MSHTIGFCEPRDAPRVMQFIDAYYRAGHPLATHRDLLDWQYGNGDRGHYNIVVAVEPSTSEILGLLGFVDSRRYDPALAPDNCLWLALWQVKPGVRIPSLGPALLRFLQTEVEHTSLAVSGIRAVLKPLYRAMGFQVIELAHHFLLNPTVEEHQVAVIPKEFSVPVPVSPNADLWLCKLTAANFFTETRDLAVLDRTPRKTPTYFFNRYLLHPFYQYLVFGIKKKSVVIGLLAVRIVAQNGSNVMRIVDVLIDSADVADLGSPLARLILEAECEYGDLLQTGLDASALAAAGFGKVTPESGVIVPNYFEPFVRENAQITSCFRTESDSPFVVCKGDGDQDRPNIL